MWYCMIILSCLVILIELYSYNDYRNDNMLIHIVSNLNLLTTLCVKNELWNADSYCV